MGAVNTTDDAFMDRAFTLARMALDAGDTPYGAVLVGRDGAVVAEDRNATVSARDLTAHAELAAVRNAGRAVGTAALAGSTMYASGEPCPMCSTAMALAGVTRVVFGISAAAAAALAGPPDAGIVLGCREVLTHSRRPVTVEGPIRDDAAAALFGGSGD